MIYLDYQATTPLAPEALEAMLPWLGGPGSEGFGNPHSPHRLGRRAAAAIAVAREQVAGLFPPGGQVIFTSGATEALNLAIRGSGARHIAVSAIEHAAVAETARAVAEVTEISVDTEGLSDPTTPLPDGTDLVAVMQVNNEIGTIQPVAEWAAAAREAGALFLCDAVQSYGKMPLPEADLIAISAHKFHGPKGIGALWVRDRVALARVQSGGGQEAGLRSGTLSPALIAGMGAAAERLRTCDPNVHFAPDAANVARTAFGGWTLNGSATRRWPGNLSLRRDGLDVARLMSDCREIMFSAGSACASGSGKPSHVLRAIGLSPEQAKATIRIGFGRYTTPEEIERAAALLTAAAEAQGA